MVGTFRINAFPEGLSLFSRDWAIMKQGSSPLACLASAFVTQHWAPARCSSPILDFHPGNHKLNKLLSFVYYSCCSIFIARGMDWNRTRTVSLSVSKEALSVFQRSLRKVASARSLCCIGKNTEGTTNQPNKLQNLPHHAEISHLEKLCILLLNSLTYGDMFLEMHH